MHMWRHSRWVVLLLLLGAACPNTASGQHLQHGLKVPPGFSVTEYAGSDLANDIYTLTVDPKRRIVVAGRGYLRILVDADNDGRADKALPFASSPKDGAMGMLWEGNTLYVTGDGGLRKFVDADGDDQADGPATLIRALKTGREHGAHALRRGPDGWLYVLCGNNTDVDASYAQTAGSPIQKPVAGCVLRFSPDFQKSEIVAHGFRNPYGMDFNPDGELFTYDSDNERCVSLPWYEHTRFYHVVPGGFYGWLNPQHAQFWRCPPHFVDVVAPATTLGRGSPTGVVCYRRVQFPAKYRGGMFALDWTFGKVYFLTLKQSGSSYTCSKEIFLQSVGDNGFAPTDAVVHPTTGDLFISIGGRGTRGAVYRVRYEGPEKAGSKEELLKLQPAARTLAWEPVLSQALPAQAKSPDKLQRLQAMGLLAWHQKHFTSAQIRGVIAASWDDPDRYLRQAAATLYRVLPPIEREVLAKQAKTPWAKITVALGQYPDDPAAALHYVADLAASSEPAAVRLECVRVVQLCLGDLVAPKHKNTVWEGYSARIAASAQIKKLGPSTVSSCLMSLRKSFPTGSATLDLEIARVFAMLEDPNPQTLEKVISALATSDHPGMQVHYLIVAARLPVPRPASVKAKVTATLVGLDQRLAEKQLLTDTHWPLRLKELYVGLAARDATLGNALLQHKDFGRPGHALFALCAGFDANKAALVFADRARANADYSWNADVVDVIAKLPGKQALPILRPLWGKAGLDAALLLVLALHAEEVDRPKFVKGLKTTQLATVQACLHALRKLPGKADNDEVLALLMALNRLPADKAQTLAQDIASYLETCTGEKYGTNRKAWLDWFAQRQPDLANKLTNPDGVDVAAWKKRVSLLPWQNGDSSRGQAVFQKASCAACHSGGSALGPDLQGVAKRFSQEDLLWAVVQPSRDISDRYQTVLIEMLDGKLHQGMVIYQATDGVMLQTGATTTIRLPGDQIAGEQPVPGSLMPAGLLDNLTDQQIVDLFAYLRSL